MSEQTPSAMTPDQVLAAIKSAISLRLVIAAVTVVAFMTALGLRGEGQAGRIDEMRGELGAQTKTLAQASLALGLVQAAVAKLDRDLERRVDAERDRAARVEADLDKKIELMRDLCSRGQK